MTTQGNLFGGNGDGDDSTRCPVCRQVGGHIAGCIRNLRATARTTDPDTSQAAAASLSSDFLSSTQWLVLTFFKDHSHATDEDLEDALKGSVPGFSTLRKRRSELFQLGFLRDSGKRERNRAGRNMIVWEFGPHQQERNK